MQRLRLHQLAAVLIIVIAVSVPTESRPDTEIEINHLLGYIKKTDCIFIRNGTAYNGQETLKHIQNKFTYARRWIKSAEDFIKYTATKSSVSGRPYTVRCHGIEILSKEWLTAELIRFRGENPN